ncbi:hypothetical protein AG1IA_06134 [Rhizoctonia solani AG-1 IA]|uniref:Uncharacterized protein n=1 Tax=Thanatephorus cucumeris (strain AG1-IA) TaxID=983506 RepID=L8WSZ7_THACA|nr:hypothetical protein AG1IA_06134 [Rhizoctonia solani AG-1 IA]
MGLTACLPAGPWARDAAQGSHQEALKQRPRSWTEVLDAPGAAHTRSGFQSWTQRVAVTPAGVRKANYTLI